MKKGDKLDVELKARQAEASEEIWNLYSNEELIASLKDKATGEFDLAKAVKLARMREGMSRKEFCEYTGIPYRTLQEWELGHRAIPPYLFRMLVYTLALRTLPQNRETNKDKETDE